MSVRILIGDCREMLRTLPEQSVQTCVTSPPYFGLRDYGVAGQIGLEPTPDAFVAAMVEVFRDVRRVLRDDGTLWLNLGDSYAANQSNNGGASPKSTLSGGGGRYRDGSKAAAAYEANVPRPIKHGLKPKDIIGIPWRVAFALQADGWYLRSDIIWHKPNPMPESVTDRPTSAHEHMFLLAKRERYFYDAEAMKEPAVRAGTVPGGASKTDASRNDGDRSARMGQVPVGETRNLRNVWTIATQPFSGAHFATFPPALIEPCIKAGSRPGDTVLDPFGGAGTTGLVADRLGRNAILTEINPEYARLAERRIRDEQPMFADIQLEAAE